MKIRSGFVSNSSTSSFILIGWSGKEVDYDYEEDGQDFDYYGEEGLVGISLPEAADYATESVDILKLNDAIKKAMELKEKLGYSEDPKLIYGMRYS